MAKYRYYRLFAIDNYGAGSIGVSEMEMIKAGESIDLTDSLNISAFSASSVYDTAHQVSKAFDNVFNANNTGWFSANGSKTNQWIQVDFGSSVQISTLNYQSDALSSGTYGIKNYRIEGSLDGVIWDVLASGTFVQNTAMQTVRFNVTVNKFLISSGNENQSLMSDLNDLIPKMTSDILPSGIATCSSTFSTSGAYNAFNAFDKSIVQTGSFNSWVTASGQLTGWLAYEFPSDTVVNKYTLIHGYNNVNVAPKSWTFEGTNDDGLTWTVLDQRSNVTDWTLWTEKEFEFVNIKKFKKYKINIFANNGSTSYVGIQELKMYDTNKTLFFLSFPL